MPTLVQLLFVWNALPRIIPALKGTWFTPFMAAALALSMNEGAYAAEIVRGGLLAIDDGQKLAARALGLSPFRTFRRVIAPQLVRVIIPPISNDFITLLKITSLAYIISLRELLNNAQLAIASTFRFAELVRGGRRLLPGHREHLHGHPVADREALRVDIARARGGACAVATGDDAVIDGQDLPVGHLLDAELLHEPVAADEPAVSEYILEARGIHKRYGRTEVLRGVSLGVHRGDVKAVLGPSGSGKSTMLRCLALLEPLDAGEVRLEGQRIGSREGRGGRPEPFSERVLARQRSEIGMVFQRFNLFPHLTALGNVMIGLTEVRGRGRAEAREIAIGDARAGGPRRAHRLLPVRAVGRSAAACRDRACVGHESQGDAVRRAHLRPGPGAGG